MSRRSGNKEEFNISNLIIQYFNENNTLTNIKKQADDKKSKIKDYFIKNNLSEFQVDNIICTVSTTDRSTFNEEAAIEILEKSNIDKGILNNIIKTKKYIDEDALEKAIYNNKINGDILSNCITKNTSYTLRVKQIKK